MTKVTIDFENLNPLALEITKSYLAINFGEKYSSPKEFTGSFITTYSLILTELESILQNKELLNSMIVNAMNLDFSKYEED